MGELLDHLHVFAQGDLNWRHREQSPVKRTILLAGIAHHIVEIHAGQSAVAFRDMYLEVLIADRAKDTAAVMKHHVPSAMIFTKQEQRRLIDAVGDAVTGHFVECSTQASGRREQIGEMKDVHRILVGRDHTRPPCDCWNAHATLQHIAFPATQPGVARVRVERVHGAVIAYPHDQGVFGDSLLLKILEEFSYEVIEVLERFGELVEVVDGERVERLLAGFGGGGRYDAVVVSESIIARPWGEAVSELAFPPAGSLSGFCAAITDEIPCGQLAWRQRR